MTDLCKGCKKSVLAEKLGTYESEYYFPCFNCACYTCPYLHACNGQCACYTCPYLYACYGQCAEGRV